MPCASLVWSSCLTLAHPHHIKPSGLAQVIQPESGSSPVSFLNGSQPVPFPISRQHPLGILWASPIKSVLPEKWEQFQALLCHITHVPVQSGEPWRPYLSVAYPASKPNSGRTCESPSSLVTHRNFTCLHYPQSSGLASPTQPVHHPNQVSAPKCSLPTQHDQEELGGHSLHTS